LSLTYETNQNKILKLHYKYYKYYKQHKLHYKYYKYYKQHKLHYKYYKYYKQHKLHYKYYKHYKQHKLHYTTSTINNIQVNMKVLIVRSSHKNSKRKEAKSVNNKMLTT